MSRVETGVVQFGDDWPGVFIRGDNAGHYALVLRAVADQRSGLVRTQLLQLADLLGSCNVRMDPKPQMLQPPVPKEKP